MGTFYHSPEGSYSFAIRKSLRILCIQPLCEHRGYLRIFYIRLQEASGIESVSFGEYDPDLHHPIEVDPSNGTVTLTIPESGHLPIIFTGTEGERDGIENVGISGTYKAFLRLYCGRLDSPSSYGRYSARVDKPASFDSDVVLQHGYIEDEAGTNVTLTFTRY